MLSSPSSPFKVSSHRCTRFITSNQTGTNTYIIGTDPRRILIDTAQGLPEWADRLSQILKSENATISQVLLTHWHHDHVGGVPDVRRLYPDAQIYKAQPDETQLDIPDGAIFETQGAVLRALFTPGHTRDHTVFVLVDENAMFAGDNVLGHGTAVFQDLDTYIASLKLMQTAFTGRIYPGHGPVVDDGPGKVKAYIQHRAEREAQVERVLSTGTPMSAGDIVKVVYSGYPTSLHGPAEHGVLQILKKLQANGRVEESEHGWTVAAR